MPSMLRPSGLFTELGELRSQLDREINAWFDDRTWTPAIDIKRENNSLIVEAEMPGVRPEDITIEAQDGILTISGEQEEHKEKREKDYLRRERRFGSYARSLALPPDVDASKITAKTRDGVVEVTIPLHAKTKKHPVTITPTAA